VITRLHERAESYRQSGPSAAHTADLLDEAAGCISALLGDLHAYRVTFKRITDDEAAALSSAKQDEGESSRDAK
jgi:hypothetical protein